MLQWFAEFFPEYHEIYAVYMQGFDNACRFRYLSVENLYG